MRTLHEVGWSVENIDPRPEMSERLKQCKHSCRTLHILFQANGTLKAKPAGFMGEF